jgi:sugar diacid utilization regulator
VSAAVAGEGLRKIAASASAGLGCAVAIFLPSLGETIVWPEDGVDPETIARLWEHATAAVRGNAGLAIKPANVSDDVPVLIGHDVVGIVATLGNQESQPDARAWLEAAAAAAAVTTLLRETQDGDLAASKRVFLQGLALAPPADVTSLVSEAQRLGCDLGAGAVAICAEWTPESAHELPDTGVALLAEVADGRVLGLAPVLPSGNEADVSHVCSELERFGLRVAVSVPRRDPAALHDALREADVMLTLGSEPDAMLSNQEETYRLLIGVLLRDPAELEMLRASTISALEKYDAEHDTDLLATLKAFLAHHGSTTETAEAMRLHRHTVGYRLTRVQEVSGLSPYESDGRERLSLGLKAHRILAADRRRGHH